MNQKFTNWLAAQRSLIMILSALLIGGFAQAQTLTLDSDDLVEVSLDGASIDLFLDGETFADENVSLSNIQLNNAPAGLTVASITLNAGLDNAEVELAYNGGNINDDIANFGITLKAAELSGASDLSATFAIIAVAEENVSKSFNDVIEGKLLGSFQVADAVFDAGGAEIAAFDTTNNYVFFTDGNSSAIRILDITDPTNPTEIANSPVTLLGSPTSVAVNSDKDLFAVGISGEVLTDADTVQFFKISDLSNVVDLEVGNLPDMVTFTPDANRLVVANEGEPNDDYTTDPEGSVSVIDIPANLADLDQTDVTQISFTNFDAATLRTAGVRIFGPNATAAQDLEPEFIAITPDNNTAYVTCQENNAIVVIDLTDLNADPTIVALGTKDFSAVGNGLDLSNRDGAINIARWPVKGMYMPDAIAIYNDGTNNFIISANEGDAREYEGTPGFVELARIKDMPLDATTFPLATSLQQDAAIGRLEASLIADTTASGDYTELLAFGTRSFGVWDASGSLIWDSGNELEVLVRSKSPGIFNTTDDKNAFDNRSDDAGPEPEGVAIGTIGSKTYAFIGLERISAVAIYDITDETNPIYAGYISNRDAEATKAEIEAGTAGDLGPEGLVFIPADQSPNNQNLLIVTNEISGTVSVYQVGEIPPPPGPAIAINERFDLDCPDIPDGWVEKNSNADLIGCGSDGTFIDFNGFGVGAGISYLISPAVDVSAGNFLLSFDYVRRFDGPDPAILYSTDYDGSGDPANFTFDTIKAATNIIKVGTPGDNSFVNSGNIDISTINGASVYFAIAYQSLGDAGGQSLRFRIDNFFVNQPIDLISEDFEDTQNTDFELLNFGAIDVGSYDADGYVDFNGFSVGSGISWLITPSFTVEEGTIFLSLDYVNRFGGPEPEVFYSTDYVEGSGDTTATFTAFTAADNVVRVQTSSDDFVNTGGIALPASLIGEDIVIAIRYESIGSGGGQSLRFRVDNFKVSRDVPIQPAGELAVYDIQGSGEESFFEDAPVATGGIITAIFDGNMPYEGAGYNSSLGGFYLQDATGDDDATTSDGVFVSATQASLGVNLAVGDSVTLNAVIREIQGQTTLTEVTDLVVVSSGNTLPTPVSVTLPVSSLEDFEALEGMLIAFSDELTVSENRLVDNAGELRLSKGRLINPTEVIDANDSDPNGNTTSGGSNEPALMAAFDLIARNQFILDDARIGSNDRPIPYLGMNNEIPVGTTVSGVTGVLNNENTAYKLQPTTKPTFNYRMVNENPPMVGEKARLKVVAFNVLNFFNGDGQGGGFPTSRGAASAAELTKQLDKIVAALADIDGDIVGLMEIENDEGENGALNELVTALNTQLGNGYYTPIETGIIKRGDGTFDEIKVALIYKSATVEAIGDFAVLNDSIDENFNDRRNRPVLAQTFREKATGEKITVAVNHLKSKGSGCGSGDDNEYQGNCNRTRTLAAIAQADWLESDPTGSGDPDYLIIGDINSYAQEDPIDALRDKGYSNVLPEGSYTYVFDGLTGSLDYILGNRFATPQITGGGNWNINADLPDFLQYDGLDEYYVADELRSSDHDPVVIGLRLDSLNVPPPVGEGQSSLVVQVSSSEDDAEEYFDGPNNDTFRPAGSMDVSSSDLELGNEEIGRNPQITGMRFASVAIPKRAKILSASIQFTVDENGKNEDPANHFIFAEDNTNPSIFTDADFNITSRDFIEDSVKWDIPAGTWTVVGAAGKDERTSDISQLLQKIVDNPDWNPGNPMAFYIKGTGVRAAESFDGSPNDAPKLIVDFLPVNNVDVQIAASEDDAEEYFDGPNNDTFRPEGSMDVASSDIELGNENPDKNPQISGFRFDNIEIPAGAIIENAFIQLTVDATDKNTDPANMYILAENAADPASYSETAFDITSRTFFEDSIDWNIPVDSWATVGEAGPDQRTPDLKALVQKIVNSEGWTPGNAMAFYIGGTGVREAESFDGSAPDAARLVIDFIPVVDLSIRIASSEDDAEEYFDGPNNDTFRPEGSMDVTSSDLELGNEEIGRNPQITGMRFANVTLPRLAQIEKATIQFTVDENGKNEDPVNLYIIAEDNVNPAIFGESDFNITSRTFLEDTIDWNIPTGSWTEVGAAGENERTVDIAPLLQKLVNKEDWVSGSAVAFYIGGTGVRTAESFDGSPDDAPLLTISFQQSGPTIERPELVREIPDIVTRAGFDFELDLKDYFVDRDTKLFYSAVGLNNTPLPSEITLSDDEGVIRGKFDEPTYLAVEAIATSFEDSVSDVFAIIVEPAPNRKLQQISTIQLADAFDEGAAEISAFSSATDKLFVTNAEIDAIEVLDMSDPTAPVRMDTIDITSFGGGVNSVATFDTLMVAAIEADVKTDAGKVYIFNASDLSVIENYTVGALPDMVTFNNDGSKIIVANEGEPNDDYTVDPEGSISIIDISTGAANGTVTTATFTAFNGQEATLATEGVRIFGPNATVAQDLEPEYITVVGDKAYVTLQENNAVAVVTISTATVDDIIGLGFKDHSLPGNGIDVPDVTDDEIFIDNRLPIKGIYMPDAIASYTVGNTTYLVTANEGDAREYIAEVSEAECTTLGGDYDAEDGECLVYTDETEIGDVVLDPVTFPNAAEIQELAGGLGIVNTAEKTGNGEYKELLAYGARSFTIWNASTGAVVFDSQDEFEQITASLFPDNFNASDDDGSRKDRSDNKGPEPEAITIGVVDGVTYAFIGLERIGGIMVYDITDPNNVEFVEYVNNRDFSTDPEDDFVIHGDNGPEGLVFVPASESPNNTPLLIVSNEVSGTVTTYSIGEAKNPFTLAVFHNNDGESDVLPDSITLNGLPALGGGAGQFVETLNRQRMQAASRGYQSIMLSSGDNFLAGPEFDAGVADGIYYDAVLLDSIGYDAIALGNHDFDFGTTVLAEFINEFKTNLAPYVSANLEFTNVPELQALVDSGRIRKSTIVEKGGEKIGIVGLTYPQIADISSPGNTTILEDVAGIAQTEIDALTADGVNKIILISHLQGLDDDIDLADQLKNVDIVIAGGGDELLSNNPNTGDPYNIKPIDSYPIIVKDANDEDVVIVTTPGQYRFIGNLLVDFDENGKVIKVFNNDITLVTGPADSAIVRAIEDPIREFLQESATTVIATSEVDLDFRRESLRFKETNAGNLFADALLWQGKQNFAEFGVNEPNVAMQNSGGLRLEDILPAGGITDLDTRDIAAFTNIVSVMEDITPAQFKTIVEWGVAESPDLDGRFPQFSGIVVRYDRSNTSIVIENGAITTPGEKVVSIQLDDGTYIVRGGKPVEGAPNINLASIDFTLNGGDAFPFQLLGLTDFTTVGTTYQQAFKNYLISEEGLDSLVTAAAYPFDAEPTRIIPMNSIALELALSSVEVNEGETITVTVTSDSAISTDQTVTIGLSGDAIDDVTLTSATITITGGTTSGTTTIEINNDENTEGTETFTVDVLEATGDLYAGAESAVEVTILPSDVPVNLTVSATEIEEGDEVTVTITADEAVTGDQTVSIALAGDAAGDVTLSSETVTILDGETSGTVTITVTDDEDIEDEETFTVTISEPSSGLKLGETVSATITILNSDDVLSVEDLDVSMSIYPNPATDQFFINAKNTRIQEVTIISVTGKEVLKVQGNNENKLRINISDLKPGMYFVNVREEKSANVKTLRLIKN